MNVKRFTKTAIVIAGILLPVFSLRSDVDRNKKESEKKEAEEKARPELERGPKEGESHKDYHERLIKEGEENLKEIQRLLKEIQSNLAGKETGAATQANTQRFPSPAMEPAAQDPRAARRTPSMGC